MLELAPGWTMEVERGPDWLFVRVHAPPDSAAEKTNLAEQLWSLLAQHFTYRVILELDDLPILRSFLIGQLVRLHKRIHTRGGLLRLCGLSDDNQRVLRASRLEPPFPHYRSRADAVMGHRPHQPR